MIAAFGAIAGQTARLSLRSGGGPLIGLIFFLAVVTIVPFGVGPDLKLLARIGPAILWIGALLATLLGLDRLFQDDRDDGSLDLLVLAGPPLEIVVLAKCLGHWLATGLPLVIAAPVLGLLLGHRARRPRRGHPYPPRRHAGADPDRRHRRGAPHRARPWRPAGRRARPAVHDPGADLRRERYRRGDARRLIPVPIPHSDRHHIGGDGGRNHRRRRRAACGLGRVGKAAAGPRAHALAKGGGYGRFTRPLPTLRWWEPARPPCCTTVSPVVIERPNSGGGTRPSSQKNP